MTKEVKTMSREPAVSSNDTNDKHGTSASGKLPGGFELFKPSMRVVMDNLTAFLWLLGLPLVLTVIGEFGHSYRSAGVHGGYSFNSPMLSLSLIALIADLLVAPGVILLQLNGVRSKPLPAAEAFQRGLHYVWRMLGLGIVLTVSLSIAFILLIVPFFILLPRVVLSPYFMIDQDLGVFDAVRASNEAYKRHHGIWGIFGVTVLLYLPSIIPLLGAIVSVCLGVLYQPAFALRYEQLKRLDAGKNPQTPVEAALAG